jgi:hypothetical protein
LKAWKRLKHEDASLQWTRSFQRSNWMKLILVIKNLNQRKRYPKIFSSKLLKIQSRKTTRKRKLRNQ